VLLAACADDGPDDRAATPSETTVAEQTTPTPSTTVISGAEKPACPTGVGRGPADALQAVRCLYAAWKAGDKSAAAVVASTDAVEALFRERWSPPEGNILPCIPDPATDAQLCSYDYHDAVYHLGVRRSEGGWRVTEVQGPLQGE
jgi:hypothetical protein